MTTILATAGQRQLFERMSPNDQRHAVAVARTLQSAGHQQSALLQAALLHDVAKSMGQPIIHRVLIVLLKAFWPAMLARVSESASQPMRSYDSSLTPGVHPSREAFILHPFIIHAHHPAIGAAWAAQAGCDPLAVRLIARHQETLIGQPANEEEKLLAALQWADDLN
jgi:hypothetical protein